jgi:hypothetical protein
MSRHGHGDNEGFAIFLIIVLAGALLLGWWNLERADQKCKEAGRTPASCEDLLR